MTLVTARLQAWLTPDDRKTHLVGFRGTRVSLRFLARLLSGMVKSLASSDSKRHRLRNHTTTKVKPTSPIVVNKYAGAAFAEASSDVRTTAVGTLIVALTGPCSVVTPFRSMSSSQYQ